VEIYRITGPFFFGVADRLKSVLRRVESPPRVFILRLRMVPFIDATGLHALREFHLKCRRDGTVVVLTGVHPQPKAVLERAGFIEEVGGDNIVQNLDAGLRRARWLLAAAAPSQSAQPASARESASH